MLLPFGTCSWKDWTARWIFQGYGWTWISLRILQAGRRILKNHSGSSILKALIWWLSMQIYVTIRTIKTFSCIDKSMRIMDICRLCQLSSILIKQADRSSYLAVLALEAGCLLAIGLVTTWPTGNSFVFPSVATSCFKSSGYRWSVQIFVASTRTLQKSYVRDGCN